jgi:hypothetical protein
VWGNEVEEFYAASDSDQKKPHQRGTNPPQGEIAPVDDSTWEEMGRELLEVAEESYSAPPDEDPQGQEFEQPWQLPGDEFDEVFGVPKVDLSNEEPARVQKRGARNRMTEREIEEALRKEGSGPDPAPRFHEDACADDGTPK